MSVIFSIIVFIFVLGLVIVIHEFGHFIMAKRANILCHEFSLGMGPIIWSKRVKETLYCVRAIPIGGYVMMAGEEVEDEVVKVDKDVRLVFDDFNNVEKIILDVEDEKYDKYERVTVTHVDLKGENDEPLYINDYTVKRNAFYVFKNRELQIAPYERSFESKTKMERFLSIFAGPFMNLVLAVVIFTIVNLFIGFPEMDNTVLGSIGEGLPSYGLLEEGDKIVSIEGVIVDDWQDISDELDNSIGDRLIEFEIIRDGNTETVTVTPILIFYSLGLRTAEDVVDSLIIEDVNEESKAYDAGFVGGDQILTIDGTTVFSWLDVSTLINDNKYGELMTFTVLRNGTEEMITIEPHDQEILAYSGVMPVENYIGISPEYNFDFFRSFTYSFTNTKNAAMMIFNTIGLLFSNDNVGVGDLAGPVGIYSITSTALSGGLFTLLGWVALLSVNLAVINLLPIPALDGGRLVFLAYEAITTKQPNKRIENTLHYAMYLMLLGLFVYITFNDILRLFNLK
jgi:regulator of sigma E protease